MVFLLERILGFSCLVGGLRSVFFRVVGDGVVSFSVLSRRFFMFLDRDLESIVLEN